MIIEHLHAERAGLNGNVQIAVYVILYEILTGETLHKGSIKNLRTERAGKSF